MSTHEAPRLSLSPHHASRRRRRHGAAYRRNADWIPAQAHAVLDMLTSQIPADRPVRVSNKRIMIAAGYGSEGEISAIMRWLAGADLSDSPHRYLRTPSPWVYIERQANGYGYTLTRRSEPRRPGAADRQHGKGFTRSASQQDHDRQDHDMADAPQSDAPTPPPQPEGSDDPSSMLKESESLVVVAPPSTILRPAATPDTTAIGRALAAIGGYDALRQSMPLRPLPGSADELRADYRLAVELEARGVIRSATAVTIAAWQAGGRVRDRAPSHQAPSRRPRGQPESADDTARYFAEAATAQADDPERAATDALWAHARRICPDDASTADLQVILAALACGASDAEAVAAMRQKRATPPWAGARPC